MFLKMFKHENLLRFFDVLQDHYINVFHKKTSFTRGKYDSN